MTGVTAPIDDPFPSESRTTPLYGLGKKINSNNRGCPHLEMPSTIHLPPSKL